MNVEGKPYSAKIGGPTGIHPYSVKVERRLSDLLGYFSDEETVGRILKEGKDPLIYEVYEIPREPAEGLFNVGCTVIYPGKIGDEYYFTKGHYHEKDNTCEVYLGIRGEGLILMQSRDEEIAQAKIEPNVLVYIPPGMAHRTVNTGKEELVFLAIYPSDSGHDYETIKERGFAKIVVEEKGKPVLRDNPRYKKYL
ncbi:MAG: glucose-6-phosphate isomerase family protein [Nitrososphaerota archaeon]|nr:cupin domain-containing protein [Candidatus Bathyarchaeota archaeon]MDW8048958.1 glucose-6-phosphate isomerase family protein [Nitrososphaerota archaeon]